jgi:hypothetical protein
MRRIGHFYLLVMALVGWIAVGVQIGLVVRIYTNARLPVIDGIVDALSYFTVVTNLLVAIVVTIAGQGYSNSFWTRPGTMSAAAVYIFSVGLFYTLLLSALWHPVGLELAADVALHDLIPILYTIYWIFFVPKGTLHWSQPFYWLAYPALYMAYSMLRGVLISRYQYPFANVTTMGYWRVIANSAMLLGGIYILGLIVVRIDMFVGRFRARRIRVSR